MTIAFHIQNVYIAIVQNNIITKSILTANKKNNFENL